jgi:2-alkyl-3-oxoalkanoate reductase
MRALVTGGGGFLGKAIVTQLLERGDDVTILARSHYPEIEALGAKSLQLDITKKDGLKEACEGMDVVFHVAALAGVWGPRERYFNINVEGTKNMLGAAQAAGVSKFIYTSSPSAVWSGNNEVNVTEEDCPYPKSYLANYPESKAAAERLVLQYNCATMSVCALRPHLIWGPGDPHLIPRVLERHHRLKIVGDGKSVVGICYVENGAHAHLLAADALSPNSQNAGKAYFITDIEPVVLWDWLNAVLQRLGKKPIVSRVPSSVAYGVGAMLELFWRTFGLQGEPFMTRFVAKQLSSSHSYDLTAAVQDFGYKELVNPKEGFERMIEYFNDLSNERSSNK